MKPINDFPAMWENDEARVDVCYSAAGVSTTVIVTSKFTGKILIADVGDGTLRDLLSMFKTEFVEEIRNRPRPTGLVRRFWDRP